MPHLKAGRKNPSGIPLMFAEPDLGLGGVSSDLHAPSGLVSYGLGSPPPTQPVPISSDTILV